MWQIWNTSQISRNRADFWSDVVAHGVLHAEMRAKDSSAFSGRLASRTTAGARFVSFKTAAHRVSRTASQAASGEAHVMVSLQCRGVSHIAQGEKRLMLWPAGIAMLDSAKPFTIEFPHEVERRLVLLPRRLVEPWLGRLDDGPVLVPEGNASLIIARQAIMQITDTDLTWSSGDCVSVAEALSRLLRGAFEGSQQEPPAPLRMAAIKEEIKRRLHDSGLTPAAVARLFDISTRTLHRLFESDGQSFARYVQSERLARARALIEGGAPGVALTQIALDCGFGDSSHFSRSYRAYYGESPRDTRARHPTRT
ncbi:helix-turn-helix domain-containing protein [Pseudolabrys taiwanensis]|uniref:Helix-turn-helix domain-containing protein n=1 Tax=Pseudolabrys taiwanensis TaxID=331696 RepID=A0A346A2W4_9HYPH|nr:helix-turn-helix domain-containing protein [Pseudolabrys taiwanensis]AXK83511.1 helix-turn-helix domain-containing protein [Pseudolabrys taiwanensis]